MTVKSSSEAYRPFAYYLLALLTGYMFLNKGFAYIGIAPLYVSEIGLMLGGLTFLFQLWRGKVYWRRLYQPVSVILLLFLLWQAFCTIPYLTKYRLDAARDAMLWGYAAYALLICLLIPENFLLKFFGFYRRVIPVFLVWQPVAFVLMWIIGFSPVLFKSPVPLITLKETDMGFHLASIASFMSLQMQEDENRFSRIRGWVLWLLWWVSWVIYGSQNRTAMLSGLFGIVLVVLLKPRLFRWKQVLTTGAMILGLLWAFNISIPVVKPYKTVTVSFQQITDNVLSLTPYKRVALPQTPAVTTPPKTVQSYSITPKTKRWFVPESKKRKSLNSMQPPTNSTKYRGETIQWRLNFWNAIVRYTLQGPYFWTGKGYGINLADDAGFSNWDHSLRSPHNVFITVLGRSGVPGLVLWVTFLVALAAQVLKLLFNKQADEEQKPLAIWFLICFVTLIFIACFDVFLEGPMAGIWFWSLVGFALVYFRSAKLGADTEQIHRPLAALDI